MEQLKISFQCTDSTTAASKAIVKPSVARFDRSWVDGFLKDGLTMKPSGHPKKRRRFLRDVNGLSGRDTKRYSVMTKTSPLRCRPSSCLTFFIRFSPTSFMDPPPF
ncbi:hypothetical protein NPIL_290401 [Nephila pilipes]|uniref:Uncharacterized protein n=1 Tax=Nephila pilipes TaxID=299642 RepID=A0A8X6Q7N9_NEPPI|nr:hypothetical protein NPIL_290401 [Nephila pilipes]